MGLDEAKKLDLAKRAEELAREAEQLRKDSGANRADRRADEKLSVSIQKLREIADR